MTAPTFAASKHQFNNQIKCLSYENDIPVNILQEQVECDFERFAQIGFSSEVLTPERIDSDGIITYSVWFGNIKNEITTWTTDSGDTIFNFYEDEIVTKLKLDSGNNLYLNDVFVQRLRDKSNDELINISAEPITLNSVENSGQTRARYSEWSTNPYYPVSTYVIYDGVYANNTVSWGVSTLVGLAVGAVTSLVIAAIGNCFVIPLTGQLIINALSGFAAAMITHCEIYGMEDAYYSFRFTRYSTNAASPLEYSYMYVGACYSRSNYGGTSYPYTMYYLNYFS